jgi:hypothetical protein
VRRAIGLDGQPLEAPRYLQVILQGKTLFLLANLAISAYQRRLAIARRQARLELLAAIGGRRWA